MDTHTTKEKLELFLQDQLSGTESLEILLHLEECAACRQLASPENAQEVIEKLLGNDEQEESPPPNRRGMRKRVGG